MKTKTTFVRDQNVIYSASIINSNMDHESFNSVKKKSTSEMGNMSDSLITIKSPEKNGALTSNRDECSMDVSVCIILQYFYRLIYI